VEKDQHGAGADDDKQQKDQGSGPVHRLSFSPRAGGRGRTL
jgi:hypothetical protein